MSRYIDADLLYKETEKKIKANHENRMAVVDDEFLDLINDAPTEDDVVEVVRCKDCKHYGGVTYGFVCRKYSGAETKVCTEKDHYCSYGERIEG